MGVLLLYLGRQWRPPKLAIKNDTLHILGKFHNFEGLNIIGGDGF
jgi:hypothetical protein